MSACQLRQSSLIYRRTLSAAIFALVTFQTYSAHASPSVRVVATLPQAAGAVTQHLSGDALPVGAKYRIVVSPVSAISITVEALLESGRRDRLFSADRVTANRSIVLPQDGGWYAAQATSSDVRVLVTQGNVVTEHLIRTIDSSPSAGSPSLKGWAEQTKGSGQAGAGSSIEGDFDEVYERAALYRSAAIKLALAKEPIIRSGPGVTIFRSAAPAVVLIRTDKSTGSGVVISQRGEVLTNWHVLDGAKFIAIVTKPPAGQRLNPGDVYEARILKYDQIADLALIQFQRTPPNLALLRTADERSIEVGSSVHAIGHPDGQQWTYTQGVISQVRSDFRWKDNNDLQHSATVIQTQTPINPGSSGGPLLDDKVAVVGVNTFFRAEKQGLNFAISVGEIKRFLEMRDNREGTTHERKAESPRDIESCNQKDHRQFPPLQDPITKKKLCRLTRSVSVARIFGELVIHQSMCSGTV